MTKCSKAMQNISYMSVLNHMPNLQAIVQKLPSQLQSRWRDHVSSVCRRTQKSITFIDLVAFIDSASESANDPIFSRQALERATNRLANAGISNKSTASTKVKTTSFAVSTDTSISQCQYQMCPLCKNNHDLDDCGQYLEKTVEDRRCFLKEKRLCFACYNFNHTSKNCLGKRICQKCKGRHPTGLHIDGFKYSKSSHLSKPQSVEPNATETACDVNNTSCSTNIDETVLHTIIPVKVKHQRSTTPITVYAFYDNGSTGCFMTEELRQQLQVEGIDTTLMLRTMHGQTPTKTTAVNGLIVTDIHECNAIDLPRTYTRDFIPVNRSQIPNAKLLSRWEHLHEVVKEMTPYMPEVPVALLIGSNCPKAHQPLKVVAHDNHGLFGILYPHGWSVSGPVHTSHSEGIICNKISVQDLTMFHESFSPAQLINMFELDFNEKYDDKVPGECGLSQKH